MGVRGVTPHSTVTVDSIPTIPSKAELIWALTALMEGVKEHDVPAMTGLPEAESSRVYQISSQAIEVSKLALAVKLEKDQQKTSHE